MAEKPATLLDDLANNKTNLMRLRRTASISPKLRWLTRRAVTLHRYQVGDFTTLIVTEIVYLLARHLFDIA